MMYKNHSCNTTKSNDVLQSNCQWKQVSRGAQNVMSKSDNSCKNVPSGISFTPQRNDSKNICLSNRFNGLSQDDVCEIVNDDQIKYSRGIPKLDQNNTQSIPVTVIKQNNPVIQLEPNRRPNPVIIKNPERETYFERSDGNANSTQK